MIATIAWRTFAVVTFLGWVATFICWGLSGAPQ